MKKQESGVREISMCRYFMMVIGLAFVIITLGACAPAQFVSVPNLNQSSAVESSMDVAKSDQNLATISGSKLADLNLSLPKGMVGFEGSVFVASTDLVVKRWKAAGWKISDQPFDTDLQQLPPDCTLYPHEGVTDQWVGTCIGLVLVPRDGASHISVMHTARDGNTTMIQIAPAPLP